MFVTKVIFVLSAIFMYGVPAYRDHYLKKCRLSDSECQQEFYSNILRNNSTHGTPERGILRADPYVIKNLNVVINGMMNVTMIDGLAKGLRSCTINKCRTDPNKLVTSLELFCELYEIESTYEFVGMPTLEALIGSIKIHGEGKGSVIVEKIQMNITIPFKIKKNKDCDPHLVIINDRVNYTHDVLANMVFSGNNFYVGSHELSASVVAIMNENWQFFNKTFARSIVDVFVNEAMSELNKIFAEIPVGDIFTDDVTSLITV